MYGNPHTYNTFINVQKHRGGLTRWIEFTGNYCLFWWSNISLGLYWLSHTLGVAHSRWSGEYNSKLKNELYSLVCVAQFNVFLYYVYKYIVGKVGFFIYMFSVVSFAIYQHVNARPLTARPITAYLQSDNILGLTWPSEPPDLNTCVMSWKDVYDDNVSLYDIQLAQTIQDDLATNVWFIILLLPWLEDVKLFWTLNVVIRDNFNDLDICILECHVFVITLSKLLLFV